MTAEKPMPDVEDPLTAPFWAATAERKLMVQKCAHCGYLRWPPGPVCPECQTEGGDWTEIQPTGTLATASGSQPAAVPGKPAPLVPVRMR